MDTESLSQLLAHLRTEGPLFSLHQDGSPPVLPGAEIHIRTRDEDIESYAQASTSPWVPQSRRAEVLFFLLEKSWRGLQASRITDDLERVVTHQMSLLHPDAVLRVFLALRRVRANHRHVTKTIARYTFNHPELGNFKYWGNSPRPA